MPTPESIGEQNQDPVIDFEIMSPQEIADYIEELERVKGYLTPEVALTLSEILRIVLLSTYAALDLYIETDSDVYYQTSREWAYLAQSILKKLNLSTNTIHTSIHNKASPY